MKRKFLLTFAMSTLFASSQLAFLPTMSAHAAASPNPWATSHVMTFHGSRVQSLLSSKKAFTLGDSKSNLQELEKLLGIGIKLGN